MKKLILLVVVLSFLTSPLAAVADELDTPAVAKPGELIQQLGKKLLATNWAVSEEAVRTLSLIDDPRVIPWYVKALDTNRYYLKYAALDRLARFPGDTALEGLKKGMKTQGADIGNCSTPEVAARMADNIRHYAACALSRSPHPEAKKLLLGMWDDPYSGVRVTVLHALGKMNSVESLALLRKMTQDPDEGVRSEALRYLRLRTEKPVTKPEKTGQIETSPRKVAQETRTGGGRKSIGAGGEPRLAREGFRDMPREYGCQPSSTELQ